MSLKDVEHLLFAAVDTLAAGDGLASRRLLQAYRESVSKVGMHKEFLPQEERELFDCIQERMTSVEATGDEGSVTATVKSMSNEEVGDVIRQIVMLLQMVTWVAAEQQRDEDRSKRFPYHHHPSAN